MKQVIVSRHGGAVKWLREKKLVYGEIKEHFTPEDIENLQKGDNVYGNLPIPMVADILERGAEFYLISLPKIAFSQRGTELSPDEMEKEGAKLIHIKKIVIEE